jgi:hypothetical protein
MRLRIYLFALTNTNNDDEAKERGLATLNQMYEELRQKMPHRGPREVGLDSCDPTELGGGMGTTEKDG